MKMLSHMCRSGGCECVGYIMVFGNVIDVEFHLSLTLAPNQRDDVRNSPYTLGGILEIKYYVIGKIALLKLYVYIFRCF